MPLDCGVRLRSFVMGAFMFSRSMRSVRISGWEPNISGAPIAAWRTAPVVALPQQGCRIWLRRNNKLIVTFLAAGLLSGCASFSSDQGMDAVRDMTKASLKADVAVLSSDVEIDAAHKAVAAILKR